ncbi:nuclear transport factor 2 family protein [Pseudonocardia pini]|uniref:nuclear transport factor 2 family protein n=1 Tax=Pseudonocardia pini TaxID=2758030 RepID=UPI001C689177|nr:nuclear transport factor 2 family protein [Pseudonocardia pini]
MDQTEQMLTEWQLTGLSQRFAHHLDHGDFDALTALFTPDGVFDRGGVPLHGHTAIRAAMRERPALTTRHLLTNFHFPEITADSARGVVGSLVFHGPVPEGEGPVRYATEHGRVLEFHDRYTLTDGGWRLASRQVRPIFQPEVWP